MSEGDEPIDAFTNNRTGSGSRAPSFPKPSFTFSKISLPLTLTVVLCHATTATDHITNMCVLHTKIMWSLNVCLQSGLG